MTFNIMLSEENTHVLPVETQQVCCQLRLRSVSSCGQKAASFSSSSSLFSSLHPPGWSGLREDGRHVYSSFSHSNMLVTRQQAYFVMLHLTCLIDLNAYG